MSMKDPTSKLTRWRLKLAEYDFDVQYKKGKANTNSDALSRIQILYHYNIQKNPQSQPEPQPSTSYENFDLENIDIRTLLNIPLTPENISQESQQSNVEQP